MKRKLFVSKFFKNDYIKSIIIALLVLVFISGFFVWFFNLPKLDLKIDYTNDKKINFILVNKSSFVSYDKEDVVYVIYFPECLISSSSKKFLVSENTADGRKEIVYPKERDDKDVFNSSLKITGFNKIKIFPGSSINLFYLPIDNECEGKIFYTFLTVKGKDYLNTFYSIFHKEKTNFRIISVY
jgi:hypothetical protein